MPSPAEAIADRVAMINWHATRLQRWAQRAWERDRRALARLISGANRVLTGVEIPPDAVFGPGLVIMHGSGLVVHHRTRVGRDCTLYHGVTIGSASALGAPPVLGDRVTVFPGAKVIGPISVGDDAVIGTNAVVMADVPAGGKAVAPAATITGGYSAASESSPSRRACHSATSAGNRSDE